MPARASSTRPRARLWLLGAALSCLAPLGAPTLQGADAPAAAGAFPVVERSDERQVQFSLDVPAASWRELPAAGGEEARWTVALPGYVDAGAPAQPRVPARGGWLVVPPGARPVLEVVRETWRDAPPRLLAIEPVPILHGDPLSEDVTVGEFHPGPGRTLPVERVPATVLADLAAPPLARAGEPAVTLGEPGWWRGRRVVTYTVRPVQVDGEGRVARVLASGAWRVRFEPDADHAKSALPAAARGRVVGRGDERFGFLFLNGEALSSWATEAAARGPAPHDAKAAPAALRRGTPLGYPEVRLPVPRTQLFRVRAQQLRDNGLLPDEPIQEGQIRLYQRRYFAALDNPADDQAAPYLEVEVPIHMGGEGDLFDGDDWFVFWGLRPRDDGAFTAQIDGQEFALGDAGDPRELNNDFNVYWLQLADPEPGESWARMVPATLPAAPAASITTFRRQDYFEEPLAYRENVPSMTEDRLYFNAYSATRVDVPLFLWSPVADQADATVQVGVAGFSNSLRNLTWTLTGDAGDFALPGFTVNSLYESVKSATLPAGALADPTPQLRFEAPDNLLDRLWSFVNWVRVEYDARYVALDGRLDFTGGAAAGDVDLRVTGFATDDLSLVEITDPRAPRWVTLAPDNVVGQAGEFALALRVDQTAGPRRFYALSGIAGDGIADIRYFDATVVDDPVVPTALDGADADVLVVCHPDFREAAQRWIDHRQARAGAEGLSMQVVAPQDLYDWYSGGLKSPWAIKRFCDHALASPTWGTWSLVLIGDANENAREFGVSGENADYSGDYVPTHHHIQVAGSYLPEVLASDKWYAYPPAHDGNFPTSVALPLWELYVGRLPCNSVAQLDRMIDKIIAAEVVQPGETWRRRSLFFADDEYSSGDLGVEGGVELIFQRLELDFRESERTCAGFWRDNGGLVPLEADTLWLHDAMEEMYDNDPYLWVDARAHCAVAGTPLLIAALNEGGLLAHYQGHGNPVVMAHEHWFWDDRRNASHRKDVNQLTNVGRPWMYFGMGCHLADWAQNVVDASGRPKNSLGEKFLGWTSAGAYAVYASSGFEYLTPNQQLSDHTLERWMLKPPSQPVGGGTVASRWVLGELMWASEADCLALNGSSTYRAMVAQYALLGDPLMVLDCGPPLLEATLDGEPISGEVALEAVDASNQRTVRLQARDEAGLAALQVLDSTGADLTDAVVTAETVITPQSRQIVEYELTLPVRPFDHQITVHVRDTADRLATDDHATLVFDVEHAYEFTALGDGDPVVIDPRTFVFEPGVPVAVTGVITTSSFIGEGSEIQLTGEGLEVTDVVIAIGKASELDLSFTATAMLDERPPRSVILTVDGFATSYVLEAGAGIDGELSLSGVMNFPNPMRDETRFVFRTNLGHGNGQVQVYTVSGRLVAVVPFAVGAGEVVVPWDGRDREGDRIANGVYLYRVRLDGEAGRVSSDMQRLVVMR